MKNHILLDILLFTIIILATTAGCHDKTVEPAVPDCIQQQINDLDQADSLRAVTRYDYGGEVYLFEFKDPGQRRVVISADCQTICNPDGGITPPTWNICTNFDTDAIKKNKIYPR